MMHGLIANARRLGLREVLLEVISDNHKAHALYLDLGFQDIRELLTWRLAADADPLPIPQELLTEVTPASVLVHYDEWHKEPPSWQREMGTMRKQLGHARAFRLDLDREEAAYAVVAERVDSIGLLDVGINPQFGAVRAGRPLLQALSRLFPNRGTVTSQRLSGRSALPRPRGPALPRRRSPVGDAPLVLNQTRHGITETAGSGLPRATHLPCAASTAAFRLSHDVSPGTVQSAARMNRSGASSSTPCAAALTSSGVPVASTPCALHAAHERPPEQLRRLLRRHHAVAHVQRAVDHIARIVEEGRQVVVRALEVADVQDVEATGLESPPTPPGRSA